MELLTWGGHSASLDKKYNAEDNADSLTVSGWPQSHATSKHYKYEDINKYEPQHGQ